MTTGDMIRELRRLEEAHRDDFVGTGEPNWSLMCRDVANRLEELLKAQESVRPIIEKNISTGECEDPWGRLFFCGACGKRINEKYNPDEYDKYCKHCGQAVKWE